MKKNKKKFEDFLFDDSETRFLEKALYALVDKLKEDRLDRKFDVKDEVQNGKTLDSCFSKLKLHRNFLIKKDLYQIEVMMDPKPEVINK